MKINLVVAKVTHLAGGLQHSVSQLAKALHALPRLQVSVLSLRDQHIDKEMHLWSPLQPRCFPVIGPESFSYSPALQSALLRDDADICHTEGLWMYISRATLHWHRITRRPYLVSARGMLDPWAIRNSPWKKRLVGWLFENRHLQDAACLHALSEAEATAYRSYGLRNPICIVPNGINLPSAGPRPTPDWADAVQAGRKRLLFMGRLHPKKGLMALLDGWAQLRPAERADWCLVIAGWDQGSHRALLERRVAELGLGAEVTFVGPQFESAKAASFSATDAFVLPSLSEGLPMAVLEAWSYGLPVLMTPQCNLPIGFAAGAALRAEPDADALAAGLRQLFSLPDSARHAVGAAGLELVKQRLSWPTIAAEMRGVYEWVLGGGAPPACVVMD